MKRLVVCCDGTWQAETAPYFSNIAKIAQLVKHENTVVREGSRTRRIPPIAQRVTYLCGPGGRGFRADRLYGGVLGRGTEANLVSAYWYLALNWEPGDEIFLFGFSRGAYTVRSLAGMLDVLGLMTPEALLEGQYGNAIAAYRKKIRNLYDPRDPVRRERRTFRNAYCRHPVPIRFIGAFDTVGAHGVPGMLGYPFSGFHNLYLLDNVQCARHALAIDERRRHFAACLWEGPPPWSNYIREDGRIILDEDRLRQVWFRGVHTDIGGGYPECGLSDIARRWMMREASKVGLEFDARLVSGLDEQCAHRENHMAEHNSLNSAYRIFNSVIFARSPHSGSRELHSNSWRRLLAPSAVGNLIAASALNAPDYQPFNIEMLRRTLGGEIPGSLIEQTA
ncbi:DUF2235 domain-containing protein [Nocardia sp. NPDC052566]|uniref:DUF2235 domain-containing protein n=1 Tax=Nocardia sp. NPDC052566 TaxID=3364330 RepID=UPI0037C5DF51